MDHTIDHVCGSGIYASSYVYQYQDCHLEKHQDRHLEKHGIYDCHAHWEDGESELQDGMIQILTSLFTDSDIIIISILTPGLPLEKDILVFQE